MNQDLGLFYLLSIYRELGRVEEAVEYLELRLAIAREIGDRLEERKYLFNIGNLLFELGRVEEAVEYLELRLAIAREIGDRLDEAFILRNIGVFYKDQTKILSARQYLEQALSIYESELINYHDHRSLRSNLRCIHEIEHLLTELEGSSI